MKTQLSRGIAILASILVLLTGITYVGQAAPPSQGPEPTKMPTPAKGGLPPLPDDIMIPSARTEQEKPEVIAASDFKVIPIVFVPNDRTPNPFALHLVNNRMQGVQRWYGEQLRDRTFTLEPAQIVIGTHPLTYYYGSCYPPTSSCSWPYELWDKIFSDLYNLGYPWQSNRILGVFFQHEGVGGTALGGGNQFLVVIDPPNVFGDCLEPGCAISVGQGGAAHELGHAFGLDHTLDDSDGSPGKSVMSYGFYGFPRTTFVNTSTNPERDSLYASPFLNVLLSLKNGGYEDCLAFWTVSAGSAACTATEQRSGLAALQLANNDQPYQIRQEVTASAGQTYDFSAWLKIVDPTGSFNLQIQIQALSASDVVLSTFNVVNYSDSTVDWERVAKSMTMPVGTTKARIQISSAALRATVYLDEVDFQPSQKIPAAPMPIFYNDRDAVPNLQPLLKWFDNPLATAFQLQVATNNSFNSPLVDTIVTSPFYQITNGLRYDIYYYWRVKAINGAGQSDWSKTWSFIPRTANNYYNDEFETGVLSNAWSWVREDNSHWGFGGPLNRHWYGYMGITTQAGDIYNGWNNAKNLLLRDTPPDDFEVSTTYDFWETVSTEYQQGGLLIYRDDENYIKLVRIYSGGHKLELQAEVNGTIVIETSTPIDGPMLLRIARIEGIYRAYYSPDGFSWRQLGQPITVNWSNPKMGLGAWSLLDVKQITAYFDWFRVTEPLLAGNSEVYLPFVLK